MLISSEHRSGGEMKKLKSWQNFWVKVLSGPPNCWQHIVSFAMKFDHELATAISTPEYLPAASILRIISKIFKANASRTNFPLSPKGEMRNFFVAGDANFIPAV